MLTIYFSGTGNSKYIATEFANRMKSQCYSIEEKQDFQELFHKEDTIAVCYPIYGSCVPAIMREFVNKYKEVLSEKKFIIFCTQMIFSGNGAKAFAQLIPGSERRVLYAEHFKMPNNISNFFLFPITEKERLRKHKKADRLLEKTCSNIQNGIVVRRGFHPVSSLLGKMQNTYWYHIERKKQGSFKTNQYCNDCGLCVSCCPTHNLEKTTGGIQQKNNCTLCYRCVNICPRRAAMVMLHYRPKKQYKGIIPKIFNEDHKVK